MSWNHLERQPSKRIQNAFKLLMLKFLNTSRNRFKDGKNSRLQNVYLKTFTRCGYDFWKCCFPYVVIIPSNGSSENVLWTFRKCLQDWKKTVFKTSLSQLQVIRFEVVYNVSLRSFNGKAPKRLYDAFKLLTFWRRLQLVFKIFVVAFSHIQSSTEYVWNTTSNMPHSNGRPED